ncbi:hypothetical protein PPERSA_11400 [Pseudocohnilembus persalinus]|uniref:Uncharacterized protein n=1 Tax=Pseudocohnilembus persalinus TaxID=266149 RepID=A0A0V0QQ00_PSEPJ|nr:hypothetical protein PPERSA_11400 [Pseudocohnilembus persalinus]|eukprot:KRX04276.1 hypothetical protein PPERSA_11400 [Pseudocohnilembus persalinus]
MYNVYKIKDQYDCIDFSDNEIKKLGNFSVLQRLKSLILNNNRIQKIQNLAYSLPNLENISLIGNKITELEELDNLKDLSSLKRLILTGNTVTQLPNYRLYTIARIPSLKMLDFQKVTKTERDEANKKFQFNQDSKETDAQRKEKIRVLIENAKTIEELNRMEVLLKSKELGNDKLFDQLISKIKKN